MHLPTSLLLWISKWLDEPISQTHKVKMKHRSGEYFFPQFRSRKNRKQHHVGASMAQQAELTSLKSYSCSPCSILPWASSFLVFYPGPSLFFHVQNKCSMLKKKKKGHLANIAPCGTNIARLFEQAVMIPWVVDPEFWVWGIFRGFVYCHIIVLYIVLL